ncbi:hypothetical protein Ahy_B03g065637 isoform A [Arachis hypogaea]|uniref:Uncharacterized protein n=1 Tax=Arachis hypogaea TaxID=3818 RepID=A0A445A299_ARAHY|nr:hypothetical protein Ahy_B03g065637 isoform A [Arachis hypogaea]
MAKGREKQVGILWLVPTKGYSVNHKKEPHSLHVFTFCKLHQIEAVCTDASFIVILRVHKRYHGSSAYDCDSIKRRTSPDILNQDNDSSLLQSIPEKITKESIRKTARQCSKRIMRVKETYFSNFVQLVPHLPALVKIKMQENLEYRTDKGLLVALRQLLEILGIVKTW